MVVWNGVNYELRPDDRMSRYRVPRCYDPYLLIASALCTLSFVLILYFVRRKRQRVCRDSSSPISCVILFNTNALERTRRILSYPSRSPRHRSPNTAPPSSPPPSSTSLRYEDTTLPPPQSGKRGRRYCSVYFYGPAVPMRVPSAPLIPLALLFRSRHME